MSQVESIRVGMRVRALGCYSDANRLCGFLKLKQGGC